MGEGYWGTCKAVAMWGVQEGALWDQVCPCGEVPVGTPMIAGCCRGGF